MLSIREPRLALTSALPRDGAPTTGAVRLLAGIVLAFVLSRTAIALLVQWGGFGVTDLACRWDCGWYLGIAEQGYALVPAEGSGKANWAFFPLYPLAIRAVSWATGLAPVLAGLLVSNLAILAGTWAGARYLQRTRPGAPVFWFVVFCAAGPYSFYFTTDYTEALFFALAAFAMLSWRQDRPLQAAVAAAFLSATRAVGVFLVLGFVADLVRRHGRSVIGTCLRDSRILLAILVCPLGLFLYIGFLTLHTGDGFAFSHVQAGWGHSFAEPFGRIAKALVMPDLDNIWVQGRRSLTWNALWAILGLVMIGWLVRRRRYDEAVFAAFCLGIPLTTGLTSIPRYLVGCPVFAFVLADWLNAIGRPRLLAPLVAAAAAFNLWLVWGWLNNAQFLV